MDSTEEQRAPIEERDLLVHVIELTTKMDAQTVGRLIACHKALGNTYSWLDKAIDLVELYSPFGPQEDTAKTLAGVADDVLALRREMKWELTKMYYADSLRQIKQTTRLCVSGLWERDENKRRRFEDGLPKLKEQTKAALANVLDGLTVGGDFQMSILDALYEKTGAHKHDIGNSVAQLIVIVIGGLMCVSCMETVAKGLEGADETADNYSLALRWVAESVEKILERCEGKDNVGPAIEKDVRRFLDEKVSNEETARKMLHYFWEKYDFMDFFCIVHEKATSDSSIFDSDINRVEVQARGRRAIVYFRKRENDRDLEYNKDLHHRLRTIMQPLANKNNKRLFLGLQGAAGQLGVADDHWAMAVIRCDEDVEMRTNFKGTYYWSRANKYITFVALNF